VAQAHNSLSLRVQAYNITGDFNPPLTLYQLRKAYRQHGVKLKRFKIRRAWRRPDDEKGKLKDLRYFALLKQQIDEITAIGGELVQVDECLFNQKHVVKTAWAAKGQNITPKIMLRHQPCSAVVGAISTHRGAIHFEQHPKSIKGVTFLAFMQNLRDKSEGHLFVLMDNASIHTTLKLRAWCLENEVTPLWNVPYTPQFDGIEEYWAQAKLRFKKEMLQ